MATLYGPAGYLPADPKAFQSTGHCSGLGECGTCAAPARRLDDAGHVFDTLENQFASNGDVANHVVVKMDVEDTESDTLLWSSPATLDRVTSSLWSSTASVWITRSWWGAIC